MVAKQRGKARGVKGHGWVYEVLSGPSRLNQFSVIHYGCETRFNPKTLVHESIDKIVQHRADGACVGDPKFDTAEYVKQEQHDVSEREKRRWKRFEKDGDWI